MKEKSVNKYNIDDFDTLSPDNEKPVGASDNGDSDTPVWDNKSDLADELSNARPADISKNVGLTRKKLLKTAMVGGIRYTAMLICFLIFLGASGYVASYAIQYMEKQQNNAYIENMADGKIKTKYADTSSKSRQVAANATLGQVMESAEIEQTTIKHSDAYDEYFEKKRASFMGLQRMYPDVWGWIDIPGTTVDYIVMQGKTNNDYLYTEYNGKYTRYGSIFVDYRNSRDMSENRNTILYGHNMNTARIMFAPLLDFVTDENAFRNQLINVITPDGVYTFKLFSIYDTYASYNYIQTSFASDEEFLEFCERCKTKSKYKTDVTFTKDTKLLTLSTCTVRGDGMRWALHGYLVGISN